ncbi:MAG: globin domain protein [Micrococcales bacterium]|nr:MAG: globin domain protein [Micrococcales bacterium]PIE26253.1 MAG: globin domain protein [Micrococcales bacterium]
MITTMAELAATARQHMPPQSSFRPQDRQVIERNTEFLLSLTPQLVAAFYDTLFAHEPTSEVFTEGERPAREGTLTDWWHRTVRGPLDDDYFAWMAMVGLVHVVRGVTNPMMLAMSDFVARAVAEAAYASLDTAEAKLLVEAYRRLFATVSAVIVYGYDRAIEDALFDVAGMPTALLHRLRNQAVDRALEQARKDIGS